MKLVSQSLVRRVVGPSAGSSWLHYYTPVTTTIKTVNAVPSSGVVVTLEIFFFGLGLTVTEINIKKVQKQDLKNITNVKRCRDANKVGIMHESKGQHIGKAPSLHLFHTSADAMLLDHIYSLVPEPACGRRKVAWGRG